MMEVLKEYSKKRLDLLKLEATEKGVNAAGSAVIMILLAVFSVFFLILLNIGLALLIGQALHNLAYGFLIMTGFYLLLLIIIFVAGKGIKKSVANMILKSIYKN